MYKLEKIEKNEKLKNRNFQNFGNIKNNHFLEKNKNFEKVQKMF